ncbi:DUF4224 domain-containing protein [Paraburkholderia sp. B3]|uniref:DUF4224 domain-containing protein n=1 Tax=Paraburkholderia sp. B3 TaxID=3134791 RepID=UPI003981AD00
MHQKKIPDEYTLPFLTDAELRIIAAPLRQPAAIIRWFRRQGFDVRIKPNGMPLLSRTHFDDVMAGRGGDTVHATRRRSCEPDVAAFLNKYKRTSKSDNGPNKNTQSTRT